MLDRLSDERGVTLIELVVAMAIFLGILSATLAAFNTFQTNSRRSEQRNDASEQVRRMIDSLTRDLRNLADPTTEALSIEKKAADDLVFRSVDPDATGTDANRVGVRRVRYCLDAQNGLVYRSVQRWTTLASPAVPATDACGAGDAWSGACAGASTCVRSVASQFVVNNRPTPTRALFTYNNASADSVTFIRVNAYVDVNSATRGPVETSLESGVTLRNQNRRPVAVLDPPVSSGASDYILNASASSDPEGALLTYEFLRTTGAVETAIGPPQINSSLVTTLSAGDSVRVKVTDPGGLSAYSNSYTVSTP